MFKPLEGQLCGNNPQSLVGLTRTTCMVLYTADRELLGFAEFVAQDLGCAGDHGANCNINPLVWQGLAASRTAWSTSETQVVDRSFVILRHSPLSA